MKDIGFYAEKAGIFLTKEQYLKFQEYGKLLTEWNDRINLTSIILPEEIALKHFSDSICVIPYIMKALEKSGKIIEGASMSCIEFSMIDIGSGAGFPGIPIKILCPRISLTLLDSTNKKLVFLDEVINALALDQCMTIHSRAEDGARSGDYREKFDVAIARAVSGMPALSEYCLPYVKVGGFFTAMKSNVNEELESADRAIRILGGEVEECHEFLLPESDIHRSVVIIRKVAKTPAAYPRKAGKPEKEPIL